MFGCGYDDGNEVHPKRECFNVGDVRKESTIREDRGQVGVYTERAVGVFEVDGSEFIRLNNLRVSVGDVTNVRRLGASMLLGEH